MRPLYVTLFPFSSQSRYGTIQSKLATLESEKENLHLNIEVCENLITASMESLVKDLADLKALFDSKEKILHQAMDVYNFKKEMAELE